MISLSTKYRNEHISIFNSFRVNKKINFENILTGDNYSFTYFRILKGKNNWWFM